MWTVYKHENLETHQVYIGITEQEPVLRWGKNGKGYRKVAGFIAEESGITMDVYTDLPGMHLYTANFIEKENGKCGAEYRKRHAVCFETQYFPDAVNKEQFESPVVKAGEMYDSTTTYKFGN